MMQKRKSYLSLLLASFLLLFTYSFSAAQDYGISFENKPVPRCVTADMSVYVTSSDALGAFEVIFEVGGDFDSFTFTEATLPFSTNLTIDGNIVRFAGFMGDVQADACLPGGTNVVIGTLHFETSDVCLGEITVASATVDDPFTHGSLFVGCDPIVEITPTFTDGLLTIENQGPEITCPTVDPVQFGETVMFDVEVEDPDNCETLAFSLIEDSPEPTSFNASTGSVVWTTNGDDVCDNTFTIEVRDKCGAADTCEVYVCVQNTPPSFGDMMWAGWVNNDVDPPETINVTGDIPVTDVLTATLGIELIGQVNATDDAGYAPGPSALHYSVLSFDGETDYGTGLVIDPETGMWSWDIAPCDIDYTGDFTLCLLVDDGAEVCTPCSPENADTLCFDIHVTGFYVDIEDEDGGAETNYKGVIQGTTATVSIDLNGSDPIGGFDFLVSYDASALAALNVLPGSALTDTEGDLEEFEYFTYRFVDNCGGGCPTGVLRIVGMRESNDGVLNTHDYVYSGTLADINFMVSGDLTFECQFVPIRFYWRDCGDNTLSDLTGNFLFLANGVYDSEWGEIIDDGDFGFYGPAEDCYDVVQAGDGEFDPFKGPLGAVCFMNGGIKIICINEIDDRGDVNLNGIYYEVADAVVFTNYFIEGMNAFTINPDGQTAATDVNADGKPLTVADLVYLIRILVGDALPYAGNIGGKLTPTDMINVGFNGDIVNLSGTDVAAALFVFDNEITPTLTDATSHMSIKYGYLNGETHVLVYNMEHDVMSAGEIFNVSGDATLIGVEAADALGNPLDVALRVVPTDYALMQNYPNPFNPETVIGLALPFASNWNISIYNVSGQLVKEFSGYSEAGTVKVTWDATDIASGMYFYKATTDQFSATKKMVLLK